MLIGQLRVTLKMRDNRYPLPENCRMRASGHSQWLDMPLNAAYEENSWKGSDETQLSSLLTVHHST